MDGINGMNRNTVNPNRGNNSWGKDELSNNGMNSGKGLLEERSGLSVDDFLKIMAAEMQNQSPMGDSGGGGSKTDYVSQLAQFTSLELMSEVVDSLDYVNLMSQQQHAFSLIGKEVSIKVPEIDEDGKFKTDKDGKIIMKTIEGTVEKIKFKNGIPLASVRDADGKLEDYDLGYIMQVGAEDTIIGKETPMVPEGGGDDGTIDGETKE